MTKTSAEKRAETAADLAELCVKAFPDDAIGGEIAALARGEAMTTARVYAALAEIARISNATNYATVCGVCGRSPAPHTRVHPVYRTGENAVMWRCDEHRSLYGSVVENGATVGQWGVWGKGIISDR